MDRPTLTAEQSIRLEALRYATRLAEGDGCFNEDEVIKAAVKLGDFIRDGDTPAEITTTTDGNVTTLVRKGE